MYEFNNWNGSLTEISSSVAYKIKLNEAKDIQLTGEKVAVEDTKISINKNWNWLPFPVFAINSLATKRPILPNP